MTIRISENAKVFFNGIKHHAGYLSACISGVKTEDDLNTFLVSLLSAGHSETDIYIGNLTYEEIIENIDLFLVKENINSFETYYTWIHSLGNDYRKIRIIDHSEWILRIGEKNENRFVHVHPARLSLHTCRFHSLSLKTAGIFMAISNLNAYFECNIENINLIRTRYLNASPVKKILPSSEISRAIEILQKGKKDNYR